MGSARAALLVSCLCGCNALFGVDGLGYRDSAAGGGGPTTSASHSSTATGAAAGGTGTGGAGATGSTGGGGSDDCGNGYIDPGEECDDGNDLPGDFCDACEVECTGGSLAVEDPRTNHCYRLYTLVAQDKPWADAYVACTDLGVTSHLVTFADRAELSFVAQELMPATGDIRPWIGAEDQAMEGTFVWSTGETWIDDFWGDGEPDNGNGLEEQDCVQLRLESAGDHYLVDEPCGDEKSRLCEIEPVEKNGGS